MPLKELPASALQSGRRVYIRTLTKRDRAWFLEMVRVSRELHRPWVWPARTAPGFDVYLANGRRRGSRRFVICQRSDRARVGICNLSEIVRGALQGAYMGYFADQRMAGQGMMAAGIDLVLRHAFTVMKLHRIEANIQPENVASEALVEQLGFTLEGFSPRYLKINGRWRDHNRWAIRSEQWRSRGSTGR